ncbi:hypothetical protein SDRG_05332 [Saprolegnia diclina VS20]|uniref:Uncharacterized protein n=2 Tax=Saprolegnia TaxID=4769 RepID=A0A067CQR5_SAPPC|nr:hypothetical protein SDRG_05332 [Saprolegnia diclina VS20]XP_012197485.1 hypothetical protein SPRG_03510 [Saprolegnia parasitica CBS 223.65]EQC37105.1 hypothetical protein SDRG_05332 [Saprolegnia diclina VS20]KDO31580.1 hypothetical protein SPRG_03510 [Saprolegnia parasitica CBS 223.65]|eukprot:XP_008609267.1 hypothetical protein SDRG_05332 [Saprolegnia diclina VS20]
MQPEIEREMRRIRNAMRALDANVKKLAAVNNHIVTFNSRFGGLMTGISLQQSCIEPPKKKAPPPSKIPVLAPVMSASPTTPTDAPRPKKAAKSAPKPPPSRTWNWPKGVRSKIPKKYQTPSEMNKVERILFVLADSLRGMAIGDLVKATQVTVIQCKEILQTLMKLEQIKRKREKEGFIYCRA